jgi:3-hydroxypropanoate dehydrogenase
MTHAVNDEALDTIFRNARTYRKWQGKPVSNALLMAVYDLMRMGPTEGNNCPARIVFVVSPQAKARLMPLLDAGNREKTQTAAATAIIGYGLDFTDKLGILGPMGGFDRAGVDKEFFPGTRIKSDFLCNLGYGDPEGLRPRSPRLSFDEACKLI